MIMRLMAHAFGKTKKFEKTSASGARSTTNRSDGPNGFGMVSIAELSHGQRLEDLMRIVGENFRKNPDGVKVVTVSHPITNKDLTRRST